MKRLFIAAAIGFLLPGVVSHAVFAQTADAPTPQSAVDAANGNSGHLTGMQKAAIGTGLGAVAFGGWCASGGWPCQGGGSGNATTGTVAGSTNTTGTH